MKKKIRSAAPPYFGFPKPLMSKELCITDHEVFSSLQLKGSIARINEDVEAEDYSSAARKWQSYIVARSDDSLPEHHLVSLLSDKELMDEADYIIRHKIVAWGVRRTTFSKEINFLTFAREHRLEEFHQLTFLAYLAAAYRLGRLPKYVTAFEEILTQWFEQQEKVQPTAAAHPIWNDSGCSIRTIVILDGYNEMKGSGELSAQFHIMLLKIVLASTRWLYRAQEEYYPGSSGFDACAALVLAGTYLPEFKESTEWLERGTERMAQKMSKEYSKDGAYMEMSDAYGLKALDRLVYVFEILKRKRLHQHIPSGCVRKLTAFAEYFAKTCTPLGSTNSFNDSAYIDLTGRLKKWAHLFDRRDFMYVVHDSVPPASKKKPKLPSWSLSINMPESGRCIMRAGRKKESPYMAVEYSGNDVHSHYETSNFVMFAYGRPIIIDRGRGMTYDDPYHLFLRTSRLHSMVAIGNENIDINAKQGRVISWHAGRMFDCLILAHDGYKRKFDTEVMRTIIFVKPRYWIISDAVLKPKRTVKAISYIHTLPILIINEDGNIQCKHGPGCLIVRPHGEKQEFLKERAVANMAYFDTEMQWTDWIGFQKRAKKGKGTTFMNVIYPYEELPPDTSIIRHDAMPAKGGKSVEPTIAEAFEVQTPDGVDIFFTSRGRSAKRRYGSITTDSQLGILCLDCSGRPASYMLVNATTLEYNRKSLHRTKKPVAFVEKTVARTRKQTPKR